MGTSVVSYYHRQVECSRVAFPKTEQKQHVSLGKKCPNSEFFWSVYLRIWTEYGDLQANFLFSLYAEKYGEEKRPSLDIVHALCFIQKLLKFLSYNKNLEA